MSRTLGVLAFGAAVKVALAGTLETCSSSSPLSCSSSSTAASCCYESPGGLLLQTQFWDYSPSIGPSDSWGIHGLWYVTAPLRPHYRSTDTDCIFKGPINVTAPTRKAVTLRVIITTSPRCSRMPARPNYSITWTPTGRATTSPASPSGSTSGLPTVLASTPSILHATPTIRLVMRPWTFSSRLLICFRLWILTPCVCPRCIPRCKC